MKLDTDQRRSWKKVCCMTLLASSSFLFLSPPFLLLLQWCSSARTRVSICFYFLALLLLRTFFSLKFLSFSVVSSELKHQRNWSALRGTKNHRKVNTSLLWSGESLKAWQSWNYIDTHLIPKMSKISLVCVLPYHYSKSTWSTPKETGEEPKEASMRMQIVPLTDKKWDWRWWWRKNKHNPRQSRSSSWLDNILTGTLRWRRRRMKGV